MTTEVERELKQSLERMVEKALTSEPDWQDVRARAGQAQRRLILLSAALGTFLVVAVSAAFAVGPQLWHLVAGKPVGTSRLSADEQRFLASLATGKPVLQTEPNAPALRQLGNDVSVRLLANHGGYTFYVIDPRGGRKGWRCFATGHVGQPQLFWSMDCQRPGAGRFPSLQQPVLDGSVFAMSSRNPGPHIGRLSGFAALGVSKVGLLDASGKLVATVPVVNSTYLRSTGLPHGPVQAIVAFDSSGHRVWCEGVAADPCHNGGGLQHLQPGVPRQPPPPPRPKPLRLGTHLQHGAAGGVAVDVYEPGIAVFELRSLGQSKRSLIAAGSPGCLRARFLHGRWLVDEGGFSSEAAEPASDQYLRIQLVGPQGGFFDPHELPPPYDGCEIGGLYGHHWNDRYGPHSVVEVPLTEIGRHFFEERATARDLAYFVRSGPVQRIRLSENPLRALDAFVRKYPGRVVRLRAESANPPTGAVGFWLGKSRILFSEMTPGGRRLFVSAKRHSLALEAQNLGELAFVF
jgi:hypothetical protein